MRTYTSLSRENRIPAPTTNFGNDVSGIELTAQLSLSFLSAELTVITAR